MNAISPPRHARDDGGAWRHISEIADGFVHRIGLRAISLLSWGQYVAGLDVSAREAA